MERKVERGRAWLITVQAPMNTGLDWKWKMPDKWKGKYEYRCQSYEKGKDACGIHTHILIQFSSQRRSNTLANDIIKENPGSEVDVELKRGSWMEARNYVMKQDETKIDGVVPEEEGKAPRNWMARSEREEALNKLMEQIKENGLKGVVKENPEYIIRYPNGCKLANELIGAKSEKRTILTTVVWGKAGSGKSTWVIQEAKRKWDEDDIYYFSKVGGSRETVWFNGYRGQKCLVMDDINGKSMPLEYMLKITGNDPMDVEYKGGREAAMWEEVYITSNYNPIGWYTRIFEENEEVKNAFLRRINRIIHVEESCDGIIWKVEKEEAPHVMKEDFEINPIWEKTPDWIRKEREEEERKRQEETTEKSGIGLVDETWSDEEINDTPGNSIYWGGEDMALTVDNCSHEEWERNWEKREALTRYFEILKKTGAVKTRAELLEKIIHGKIPYEENDWIGEMKEEERKRKEREEEMIKEAEAVANNGNREEKIKKNWNEWIWEKICPEETPCMENGEEEISDEERLFQILCVEKLSVKGEEAMRKKLKRWGEREYIRVKMTGISSREYEKRLKEKKEVTEMKIGMMKERGENAILAAKRGDVSEAEAFCRQIWRKYLKHKE